MTPAGHPVTGDPELDEWMYLCRMIGQFTGTVLQNGYIMATFYRGVATTRNSRWKPESTEKETLALQDPAI